MDGMLGRSPLLATPERPAPLLGILYAEDFDDALAPVPEAGPAIVVEQAPPALAAHDIERACAEAVAHARAEWEQEAAHHRQRSLGAIAAGIAAARDEAAAEAAALAEGTVVTMLSMLSGALPRLCREHGPAEARALVERLLPNLRTEPRITIRVHPSLVAPIEQDLALCETELAGTVTVMSAPLEPGDLRVTWENGSLKRDTRAICAAIEDALAQLGLHSPIDFTPERRMEHAE